MTYREKLQEDLNHIFENDDLGIFEEEKVYKIEKHSEYQAKIETLLAINNFYKAHHHEPSLNAERGSDERKYARNLIGLRRDKDDFLREYDEYHLIFETIIEQKKEFSFEDIFEDDDFGLFGEEEEQVALDLDGILTLKHVTVAKNKYDSGKGTKPCDDFEKFKHRFEKCHSDLKQGRRKLIEFKGASRIEVGNFYLLGGQLAYVDNLYNIQKKIHGRIDARLRLIFENGTESDMLRNSLERRLYEKNGKAITELEETNQDIINQRMQGITQDDKEAGYIYILKSKSQNYDIASIENLYKIGLARESVEKRIKNAHKETTYLNDEVELIAQYKCYNLNLSTLENLIHRFFAEVRLDVSIIGEDGREINPKEWFIVPLEVINEAIELLISGSIVNYRYDKVQQKILLRD